LGGNWLNDRPFNVNLLLSLQGAGKKAPTKSRDEATQEKKQELEKRLENVKGQLNTAAGGGGGGGGPAAGTGVGGPKKANKKGIICCRCCVANIA